VLLTPNERRIAEDRPDCYWLYVVTECKGDRSSKSQSRTLRACGARGHKVSHYYLSVDAITGTMQVREKEGKYE